MNFEAKGKNLCVGEYEQFFMLTCNAGKTEHLHSFAGIMIDH